MGEDALVYAMPWFADPQIGSVGAVEMPRTDTVTWFSRLRTLEALFQFALRPVAGEHLSTESWSMHGTFTAFRRAPALTAGGFPIGMNGEDTDLTMQIGRLGYRVVVDPRIISHEDVPRSPGEFVEQRTRWARAGYHTFARHVPTRAGSAGPRVWFWTLRRGFSWFSIQAGLIAPIFLLELALTSPTYRENVVTFAVLYILGGGIPVAISLPYAVKYRYWRSILWAPTWFAYAFLRRVALLEAAISLPTRPFPASPLLRRRPPWTAAPAPEAIRAERESGSTAADLRPGLQAGLGLLARLRHEARPGTPGALADRPQDPVVRAGQPIPVRSGLVHHPGQRGGRRGLQRGVQQRPGQLVQPAAYLGRVLRPQAGVRQPVQQIWRIRRRRHVHRHRIDQGAGRRAGLAGFEGVDPVG